MALTLRNMRLALLVLCPANTMPQGNPKFWAVWVNSFSTVHTRRFFERFVFGCQKLQRYDWLENDTARAKPKSPLAAGWKDILFDPKLDLEIARSLPQHYVGFPISYHFL
jgi:hypothetical protein